MISEKFLTSNYQLLTTNYQMKLILETELKPEQLLILNLVKCRIVDRCVSGCLNGRAIREYKETGGRLLGKKERSHDLRIWKFGKNGILTTDYTDSHR